MILSTDFKIGYIVALLEGEGSFLVKEKDNYISFEIKCSMDDKEPLLNLKKFLGGEVGGPYYRNDLIRNPYYVFYLGKRKKVILACNMLRQFMSPRRQNQIDKILSTNLAYFTAIAG